MPILHLIVATTLTLFVPQECSDWQACRDLAAAAATRQDFEAFHDLAWRAVQKGPKNDRALMLMLARAQSLSGRPGDALVMLERLVQLGTVPDVATDPDFRRVRALEGWPDLERRMADVSAGVAAGTPEPMAPPTKPATAEPTARPATPPSVAATTTKSSGEEVATVAAPSPATPSTKPAEALRFAAGGLIPDGLAYDAVSRRFLIADRHARKLAVVDEFSQHVATLAGAQAAFGDIEALEIDSRAGDLWVVSSEPAAAGSATTLHKLQLVSGRVLSTYTVPPELAPAHFVDVAVANGGTILVLDSAGRVLRLQGRALQVAAVVPPAATSLAPTDNGTAYVSTADGLVRVDLASRTSSVVVATGAFGLAGLDHLRWYRGALIAVQQVDASRRIVRLRLDRSGRMVTALEPIDTVDGPAAAVTISGNTLYYFASRGGGEVVLRKVTL